MLNVSGGRYDVLEVWDGSKYVNVAEALASLADLESQIESDESRLTALEATVADLEDKLTALDQEKAPLFVSVPPLYLKTDVFPQQL